MWIPVRKSLFTRRWEEGGFPPKSSGALSCDQVALWGSSSGFLLYWKKHHEEDLMDITAFQISPEYGKMDSRWNFPWLNSFQNWETDIRSHSRLFNLIVCHLAIKLFNKICWLGNAKWNCCKIAVVWNNPYTWCCFCSNFLTTFWHWINSVFHINN